MEVFEWAIKWIENHPALAGWVQGLGTTFAGFLALGAGYLAYRGAVAQAITSEKIHQQEVADQRRAIAGALWAELNDCRSRILGTVQNLRTTKVRRHGMLTMNDLHIEIYLANLAHIGQLPSDEAWVVVTVYKMLLDQKSHIDSLRGRSGEFADSFPASLADRFELPLKPIDLLLPQLAALADFKSDVVAVVEEQIGKMRENH